MSDSAVALGEPTRAVGDGGADMVQLLTPEGQRVPDERYDHYIEALDEDTLRSFYRDLVLVRRLDAEGTPLQRQGQLGLWASLLGQEGAQVGCGRAMLPQDYAFPGYREHGIAWCRGVDPIALYRLFRGADRGGSYDPAEKGFNTYSIVIGNNILLATGYAMGVQLDGAVGTGDPDRDTAVVAFLGDGATAQGDVNEGFVFASVNDAPIVFFCQNNQWAISEPNARQTRTPIYQRASGFGFPGVRVDGNDVLATYAVTRAMLERARSGEGPSLIEAFTYRMGPHTTTDDPTRYRVSAEVEEWRLRDPLARYRAWLSREGIADSAFFEAVDAEADELGNRIRSEVNDMPDPDVEVVWSDVYAEPHQQTDEDRAAYLEYLSSFETDEEGAR